MKRLRHYFLVLPTQCCFYKEPDPYNPRDRASSHFYLSDSAHKKSFSSSSLEQESFTRVPRLLLEVKDGPGAQIGKTFQLTPSGVKESCREVVDGKMMIGSDRKVCDIVLDGDSDIGEMHCVIEFHSKNRAYFLKDLGDGNGTFIKVEDNQAISTGDIVNFGDSHARVLVQEQTSGSTVTLQFYEGPLAEQECCFRSSQQPITIGRVQTNTLSIDDVKLSIGHCFLTHTPLAGWMITDGDCSKRSANGTW